MNKPAITDYPVQEFIRDRWSPRAFSEKPIPPEILCSLFEAARWAPSCNNEQPWAFVVTTKDDPEPHNRTLSTLVEANRTWAQHAPVLGIALFEQSFGFNSSPNRYASYDTGAAMANLSAEATTRGLFVHQMAGFDPGKASELFHIPNGWEPIAAFVIGYPGDPQSLPEKLRGRELGPRSRKPLSSFVMSGSWGHPANFLKS